MKGIQAALCVCSDRENEVQSNQVLSSLCVWSVTAGVKQSKLGVYILSSVIGKARMHSY